MDQELISLNSDTVNRQNVVFLTSSLIDVVKNTFNTGIPKLIGHDIHRPVGFTFPFAVYMEPHISRMLGIGITPTNQAEQNHINLRHQQHILKKYQTGFKPYEANFLNIVGSHITDKHSRIVAGCAAIYDKDIALKLFPKLFNLKDSAGLISLSDILEDFFYQGQGVFKSKNSDLAIYADKSFRRRQSVHNNFHFYFLNELLIISKQSDLSVKICIDEDLIGYGPSYHDSMELEYHWGPKFNDDISSIKMGLTRHECDDFERAYYGLSRTEFYWKADGSERTFELEEVRDQTAPQEGEETYNCRYVHSIYDTSKKTFFHFDGAIRSYGFEQMSERIDKDFLAYGRKANYKKLFRIDGPLALEKWKLLILHYMQGNPLIYEYFGLGEEYQSYKIQHKPTEDTRKVLPFEIDKSAGVRLLISYHNPQEEIQQGRFIETYNSMSTKTESFNCVEHPVYELKKALMNLGADLEIAADVMILKIDDRYINIPTIIHSGPEAEQLLQVTIQAYTDLFKGMVGKGIDKDVAFTLGIVLDMQLLKISVYGNVQSILAWVKKNLPFPTNDKQFSKWINTQRKYLEAFQETSDNPSIASLVQFDGALHVPREHVSLPYDFSITDRGLNYSLEISEEENDIYGSIETRRIRPFPLIWVKQMIWSDTSEDYFTSTRSKWRDSKPNDAHVVISKWEPLGLYWSKT